MIRTCTIFLSLCLLLSSASQANEKQQAQQKTVKPQVFFETDLGTMVIELYPTEAPVTVANFLQYIDSGFYEGTIFHRVIDDFVVQGGGLTFDFKPKQTEAAIVNESNNGLLNLQATLSMARTANPDSATSQFFINIKHNTHLDPQGGQAGYAVFGKVVEGFEVVKKIEKEPRGLYRSFPEAPNYPVRILKSGRVEKNTVSEAPKAGPVKLEAN